MNLGFKLFVLVRTGSGYAVIDPTLNGLLRTFNCPSVNGNFDLVSMPPRNNQQPLPLSDKWLLNLMGQVIHVRGSPVDKV